MDEKKTRRVASEAEVIEHLLSGGHIGLAADADGAQRCYVMDFGKAPVVVPAQQFVEYFEKRWLKDEANGTRFALNAEGMKALGSGGG